MTEVRGHFRKKPSGGRAYVRPHTRRRAGAVVAGGGGVIAVIGFIIAFGIASGDPPAHDAGQPKPSLAPTTQAAMTGPQAQLASALKHARERIGFSLDEASKNARISSSRISEIERGITVPSAQEVNTLSQAYRLSQEDWTNLIILHSTI
ncbi:helix-turn-helix domain-containing protein [Nonomuraea sp. NPDC048826]|uniref:helix-turn-helix domain-containing protein n=1 Tax=Nonomuraea sp. NPDC048826 TaxID=3364347 RepID=UPI00371E7507